MLASKVNKFNQIQQKLNLISSTKVTNAKDEAYEQLFQRVNTIEKNMNDELKNSENKLREFKDQIKVFDRTYQETQARRQFSKNHRKNEVEKLQKKMMNFLKTQSFQARECEQKIIAYFENRIEELSLAIAKEKEKRKDYFQEFDQSLCKNLPTLNSEIAQKIEQSNKLLQNMENQLINDCLNAKKKIQEAEARQSESFEQLMKMMSSVISDLKKQLQNEKVEREANKVKLIKLFEDAYFKMMQMN